jgi:magnesium transporter
VITIKLHSDGQILNQDVRLDQISEVIGRDDTLLWVDGFQPLPDEIELLREEFSLHPLAIEDAVIRHERPKVEQFDDFILIIFYALQFEPGDQSLAWHQISIFAGHGYVLTLHNAGLPELDVICDRWTTNHPHLKSHLPAILVYAILDALVDGYMPIIDHVSERIDDLEDAVFERFDTETLQRIFHLKRDLLNMRKILTPERDVLNLLMRRDTPVYNEDAARYFQDIYDHLLRVLDSVDTFRDLLSSALESYLSVQSNRMNQVMKTLTASSIILMTMSLVAGIYGMNFVHMPELQWHYGYFMALGLMAALAMVLSYWLKRRDWF